MFLDTKKLEQLAERVVRTCKEYNDDEAVAMRRDWAFAELENEALPELEEYLTELREI